MDKAKDLEKKIFENRWWILLIVIISPFMSTLDSSIVNVALPVMSQDLMVDMASIEWVITSYLIVISGTILVFGRLGDIKGKTRIYKWGFLIFTLGSFLCGLSQSLQMLIVSRIIQAVGAAATMANSQGIITHVFPQSERGRALGISGTAVALGTMVGPPLGGLIVHYFKWQYIFLINVPVGIAAIAAGMKILPKGNEKSEKIDYKGALMFGIAIALLFYSLDKGKVVGYGTFEIIAGLLVGIVLMIIFLTYEGKIAVPLLDLSIFRNTLFSLSIFTGFLTFVALGSTNIIQPFYLQYVLKLSPGITGLVMMIYPIVLSIVAPLSGHFSDKIGSEFLTFIGLLFTIAGLAFMSTLNEHSSIAIMAVFIILMSMGNGMFQSPNNSLVMSTAPKAKLGIAGSINALVRNLGIVTGVSVSTTLLYHMMSVKFGVKVSGYIPGRDDIFVYGMRYVYLMAAAVCALGAVLTAIRLYHRRIKKA